MSQLPNYFPFPGPYTVTHPTPGNPMNPYYEFYVWVQYTDGTYGVCPKGFTEVFNEPIGAEAFGDDEGSLPPWAKVSNSILNGLSYVNQDDAWDAAQRTLGGFQVLGLDWFYGQPNNPNSPWFGRIPSSNFPPYQPSHNDGSTPSPWTSGTGP